MISELQQLSVVNCLANNAIHGGIDSDSVCLVMSLVFTHPAEKLSGEAVKTGRTAQGTLE